jgi:hypothetical protein
MDFLLYSYHRFDLNSRITTGSDQCTIPEKGKKRMKTSVSIPEANAEPVSQTGLQQWILILSLELTEWENLWIDPGEQMSFLHLFRIYTAKEVRP